MEKHSISKILIHKSKGEEVPKWYRIIQIIYRTPEIPSVEFVGTRKIEKTCLVECQV
jgi:hypothetical protein